MAKPRFRFDAEDSDCICLARPTGIGDMKTNGTLHLEDEMQSAVERFMTAIALSTVIIHR
jgi:hypothetical protein